MAVIVPQRRVWTRQPQDMVAPRLDSPLGTLRHLWHFHPGWPWQRCLLTGNQASLSPHAQLTAGGLFAPSSSWLEAPTLLPVSLPVLPVTILIGYVQSAGVVPWAWLVEGQWEGVYGSGAYGAFSTHSADFSGASDTPTLGPNIDPDAMRYCAVTMSGANDLRVSVNGGPVLADTSCSAPSGTITSLRLGADSNNWNQANITCKYVAILDRAIDNASLALASSNPWELLFAPQRRVLVSLAGGGSSAQIAGAQSGTGAQTGDIVTQITGAGIQIGLGATSGGINTAVSLAGTVSGVGAANGDILTKIELGGQQLATALQTLALQSGISVAGIVSGAGAQSGNLTLTLTVGGQQLADSLISGGIATAITVAGQQIGAGAASASLSGSAASVGGSQAGAGAQSLVLSTSITLTGQQIAAAILAGSLTTEIRIGGIVGGVAVISGSLDTVIPVSGTVLGAGQVAGSIQAGQIVWSMSTARRLAVPAAARRLVVPS